MTKVSAEFSPCPRTGMIWRSLGKALDVVFVISLVQHGLKTCGCGVPHVKWSESVYSDFYSDETVDSTRYVCSIILVSSDSENILSRKLLPNSSYCGEVPPMFSHHRTAWRRFERLEVIKAHLPTDRRTYLLYLDKDLYLKGVADCGPW